MSRNSLQVQNRDHILENRHHIWSLSDSSRIRTHNHLFRKQTHNHLAKLAFFKKRPLGRLRTKWLWVQTPLPSLKLQILRLLQARSSLTFKQTIECRFTLKLVCDLIIIYNLWNIVFQNTFSKHSTSSTHLPKTKVKVAKSLQSNSKNSSKKKKVWWKQRTPWETKNISTRIKK